MHDLVHLGGEQAVDTGDKVLDRLDRVARDGGRARPFLGGKRQVLHQGVQLLAFVFLDAKILFQKVAEFTQIDGLGFGGSAPACFSCSAIPQPSFFAASSATCCSRGSFCRSWAIRFSAFTLPSM